MTLGKGQPGTFFYALYHQETVVHVGQCIEIQNCIDQHLKDREICFDRFTHTFVQQVKPFSAEANLMEAIAIARLKPKTDSIPVPVVRTTFSAPKPLKPKPKRIVWQRKTKAHVS